MTWLTVMEYLCHNDHRYVPFVGSTSLSFPYSGLIIGFVTRLTRRVPLVELDPQVLLEHLNSPQSLVGFVLLELLLYMYVLSMVAFPFVHFSFGHCVVCSSIYGYWLPLWYLQSLLSKVTWLEHWTINNVIGQCLETFRIRTKRYFNSTKFNFHRKGSD